MTDTEIAVKLAEHEEKIKVANNRIHDLEEKTDSIESLALSVQKLAISVETLTKNQIEYSKKQDELSKKVIEVENNPIKAKAEKHDKYVGQIATLLIGAFGGFILKSLFGI